MATQTTTMPRTPRTFNASKPPTGALPALPNSLASKPSLQGLRRTSLLPPSASSSPTSRSASQGFARPQSGIEGSGLQSSASGGTTPKRSVSIAESFPRPPRNGDRVASLPPPSPARLQRTSSVMTSSPLASPIDRTPNRDSFMRAPKSMASSTNLASRYSRDRDRDSGVGFEYDNVFTPSDNNAQVYESCAKRLVRRVMEGYHGTVFAYGMTGTGKTFSMQGTTSSPGVIPLAITDIFSFIRETPHREFLLRVSYLEIYNERIHDLLASQPGSTGFVPLDQQTKGEDIKLREDPKRGVYATPLKEEIVQSPTQLLRVIARGDLCRRVGSTQFNARSSRSHAVVQIVVESRERVAGNAGGNMADNRRAGINGGVRVSTLSLIDLAGSERAAEDKERRTEGAHINRSLLTRDSKLTRLLQPALSGNSLISILCTISVPLAGVSVNLTNIGETINTLKFAARARNNIVSRAKKGEDFPGGLDAGSKALLERYRTEITELRRELELQKKKEEQHLREKEEREWIQEREADIERHGEQLLEMQLARTALKERIEHLNRLILCSKSSGVNSARSSMIGPPQGHTSSMSVRSSIPPNQVVRFSTASSNPSSHGDDHDEDSTGGEFNDGNATLSAQVRALQADLTDRNRYIATLEKRLLQARRSSQNRASFGPGPGSPRYFGEAVVPEGRVEVLLKEKDEEIAELRARLDDKERMVSALRNAARKRDIAEECGKRYSGESLRSPITTDNPDTIPEEPPMTEGRDGLVDCF